MLEFAWVCVVLAPKRSSRSYEILGWLRKGGFELVLAQVWLVLNAFPCSVSGVCPYDPVIGCFSKLSYQKTQLISRCSLSNLTSDNIDARRCGQTKTWALAFLKQVYKSFDDVEAHWQPHSSDENNSLSNWKCFSHHLRLYSLSNPPTH